MNRTLSIAISLLVSFVISTAVSGKEIRVSSFDSRVRDFYMDETAVMRHVPTEYPSIQLGIDAASNGDTVILSDGIYTGNGNRDINFNSKSITVTSENGPDNCIIDCEGKDGGLFSGTIHRIRSQVPPLL